MSLFVRNLDVQCRKRHQFRMRAVIAGIAYSGQWQIVVLALANEIVHWGNGQNYLSDHSEDVLGSHHLLD